MKKAVSFIQKNMFFIVILVIGIAYILTGTSNIVKTEETIGTIIASGGISTILGWLISAMCGQQAIIDGFNDNDVIGAINTLGKEIETIDGNITKLDIFCGKENEALMIRKRTRILKKVGLNYSALENLTKKGFKNYTSKQKKAIKKALEIGYGYLTPDWLLADIEAEEEKNTKPVSVNKYSWKKNLYNLFTKTLTGVISGLYILEPFVDANWNIVIWRVFFFATWLIFGYVRYITDFNFMTKTYRKTIINKTNYIIKFKATLAEHPEWYYIVRQDNALPRKDEQPFTQPNKDNLLTQGIESEVSKENGNYNTINQENPKQA
jgi:hypothetical protein